MSYLTQILFLAATICLVQPIDLIDNKLRNDIADWCGPPAYYRRPTGVLTSVNYPRPYLPWSICDHVFRIPWTGLYNVHLKICKVDLECGVWPNPDLDYVTAMSSLQDASGKTFCSTPPTQTNLTFNDTRIIGKQANILFQSNGQNQSTGYKIAYCMEDTAGISLRCSQRSDFTCDSTNYDYIRYKNRELSEWYDWAAVSTHEGPDPPPAAPIEKPGASDVGEVESGSRRNADVDQLIGDMINVYNAVKEDVKEKPLSTD